MSEKNKQAKIKYWASLTPDQKSLIMSQRRKKGWKKIPKEDRLTHGRKLTDIRLAKKLKLSTD